jgi:uncharacterized protein (DUF1330 family)
MSIDRRRTMAGYVLVDIEWTDDEGRSRYVQGIGDVVASYDGKFLASVPEVRVMEGESPFKNRLVLLRFPTAERALEWHDSEGYAPLRSIRERSARTNMVFFEGE